MVNFIEFPVFDGVSRDLRQWIAWLEDFFVRERFTGDEKMNLAQSLLEGEANAWFYSSRKHFSFQSWEHLVVELLIWRFGDFGDGGVFSDLELFLLWNKYDRIVRKRRKRMETTSITPQESISSPATIPETIPVDKFSNQQVDEISAEKKESKQEVDLSMEKIASQLKLPNTKVHVSDSENLRNIETRIKNSVLDNFESVVKEAKIQKNIRMDVVNDSKNVSAHQVLDKMCQLKRLKPKNKKKLRLSLKTWKFKVKNKNLQHNWSQRDLLQVIARSKVTNPYPYFSVSFGLVKKKRTIQCLQLKKQAHMSRVLYQLRMLHDPGGKKDEHSDDNFETEVDIDNVAEVMNLIGDVKGKVAKNPVAFHSNVAAVTSISQSMFVCVREFASLLEVICLWADCMMNTPTVISATLYSLFSCEVDTAENISSGLSQIRQVWEPGGVLSDHVLVDNVAAGSKGLASDGCVILGMHCAGFGSGKTELLATGQQMQRTDLFSELLKDSSNGRAESFPILTVVTEHSFLWLQKPSENYLLVSAFEKRKQVLGYKTRMFKYKRRFQEISLTDTQFLCEKVQRVSCLSLAAQFNSLEIIQAVLEQIIQGETSTKIIDNAASSSGSHAKSLLIAMGFCPTLVQKAIGENGEDLELLLEILTKSTVTEEPSFRGLMEPKPEPDIESATDFRRMTLLTIQCPENLVDLALDRLGKGMPHWERMSIWHRWRRKDCTRPSSCVLPLLFSFFKLEDKLVLRGESIDTILHRIQSFYRKKKQVVTWQSSS